MQTLKLVSYFCPRHNEKLEKMITRTDPSMLQTKQSVHILALFNRLYSFFTFIYTFIVKKSPSRHIVVAPGQLHKQQECRIKLLSDVVSRSHSSGYFFRSWRIMPQPVIRCSLIDSSGSVSGHCDTRSLSDLNSRCYAYL